MNMLSQIFQSSGGLISHEMLIFHFQNFLPKEHNLSEWYFFLNRIWYYVNVALILPVMLACVNRFLNPEMSKKLWTDNLARAFLIFGATFYVAESIIKYQIDGTQGICMKAMYIHHSAGILVLASLFLNSYIPWWTCPLGFMHGISVAFPASDLINLIYASCLIMLQIGIYRKPYSEMKYYNILRYFTNFIWVFAAMFSLGECSTYMQLHPEVQNIWNNKFKDIL